MDCEVVVEIGGAEYMQFYKLKNKNKTQLLKGFGRETTFKPV